MLFSFIINPGYSICDSIFAGPRIYQFSSLICGKILDDRGVPTMLLVGIVVAAVGTVVYSGAMIKEKRV